jgi:isopenicillin N synthase-like dioxygenase
MDSIPLIDIGPLFEACDPHRASVDGALMEAAGSFGFIMITGFPQRESIGVETRRKLLTLFAAPEAVLRSLARNVTDPGRPYIDHGYFGQRKAGSVYDCMEIGPDILRGAAAIEETDLLRRPTMLPPESVLPGWRTALAGYFAAVEGIGAVLMASLARGLGIPEAIFADAFADGISAIRLLRYPPPSAQICTGDPGELYADDAHGTRRLLSIEAHCDYGFLTLLAQHGVPGLQARGSDGGWIDLPPMEGTLVVNFGQLMERWTAGRLRATEHRVLSRGCERFAIPFFYAPRVDAMIAPLPLAEAVDFEPFLYGDFVWSLPIRARRLFPGRWAMPMPGTGDAAAATRCSR